MLKYVSFDIVFSEIPNELTLAINLSNCPNRCIGCHSPHLWEDVGDEVTPEFLVGLLGEYGKSISCLCFMGGDNDPRRIQEFAELIQSYTKGNLKIAWYSGKDELSEKINPFSFDYIKLGHYNKRLGPLNKRTTNQKLYHIENQQCIDITPMFWK